MAIYLDIDRETRAATGVAAAIERVLGGMLFGPRQHALDLLLSLGTMSATSTGERTGKR